MLAAAEKQDLGSESVRCTLVRRSEADPYNTAQWRYSTQCHPGIFDIARYRNAAETAGRNDRHIFAVHGASSERINRAHGRDRPAATAKRHLVTCRALGEWIRALIHLIIPIDDHEIKSMEEIKRILNQIGCHFGSETKFFQCRWACFGCKRPLRGGSNHQSATRGFHS
jgi:hypothetical protein